MKKCVRKILMQIVIFILLTSNVAFAGILPKYVKLDVVEGATFKGADNKIQIINNSDYLIINWYGAFSLPSDIKIWSASSSIISPLKKMGADVTVAAQNWNKSIKPGETINIEFNTNASFKQTVVLKNMCFVGVTQEAYEDISLPATEEVLMIVKKREVDGGYYTIRKNVIDIYNKFYKAENNTDGLRKKQYSIILLIPMIELETVDQLENHYNEYLSKDFMQWALNGLIPDAKVDYSTVKNVLKYLKSPNLKYIYYVGDGGMMTCSGIECTNPSSTPVWDPTPNLTASDVAKLKFNSKQIWILNACHGILGSFPLALFNSGLEHFTAGATSLYQPFDSDLGVFAFGNVLDGLTLSDAMKQAGDKVSGMYYKNPSSFKGYGYIFNGVWGVVDGVNNCYLLDVLSPNLTQYNRRVLIPKKPTLKTWPFQWFSY